ncbi:Ubiquinone biosynthesis protein COQ4-like, mitochondrial, partial [Mucuna pruriens]
MGSRNFSPDDRSPVRFMDTEELACVAMRAREVHDFWHTLFDLPTNLIGETALKVIELEQMHLPMCLLSVIGGTARLSGKQRKLFYQHYFPWAVHAAMQCNDLMNLWHLSGDEVWSKFQLGEMYMLGCSLSTDEFGLVTFMGHNYLRGHAQTYGHIHHKLSRI